MQKIAFPKVWVIIVFILVSFLMVSNVSFAHPLATKYVTVTAKNDPGGVVQITYTYDGVTYGPYNTTSVETIKIPSGATVTFKAIPDNGFGFYGWNYTFEPYSMITSSTQFTFSTSQTLTFSNVQNSITAIAYFPVKLTIIDPAIWDYITTSEGYYISFVGGVAFANNDSFVPSSLVSQNTFTLNVEVQAVGSSTVVSGSVSLIPSGSVLYRDNYWLFNVYDPNGLEMKYATINWTSPKPWLYASGTIWSANDWAWGIEVTIKSGDSVVTWTLPFQNLNFQLIGHVLPSASENVYFPAGSSPSFYDTPNSGYAFLNWYMIETSASGHAGNEYTSSSNPWTFNLPSNGFAQAYNGPYFTLEPNVVNTSATFYVSAPSSVINDQVTITLTSSSGQTFTKSATLEQNTRNHNYVEATITFYSIPATSYSWSISPTSLTYYTGFGYETVNATPSSGTFTLSSTNNGTFEQAITYTGKIVNVTFTETGLANGISWWVELGTVNESAIAPNPIIFYNVPGDSHMSYKAESPILTNNGWVKYQTSQASGTLSIPNANVTQQISYKTYYKVNVIFNPDYATSNPPTVWVPAGGGETFEMTPEEDYYIAQPYSSSITAPSGITINYNSISKTTFGNTYVYNVPVTVNGYGNITVYLTWFNFIDYISENGLPSGQSWSFVIYQNGQEQSNNTAVGSPISIEEPGYDYSTNNYYQYTITFSIINGGNVYYIPTSISTSAVDVLSKTGNSVTFEITGNSENNTNIITVNYEPYYELIINAGQGGSVSWYNKTGSVWIPSSGFVTSGTVNTGQSQTIYVTSGAELQLTDYPNSGYRFTQWSMSGYVDTTQTYFRDYTANPIDIINTGSGPGYVTANYQVYLNMISNPSGAGSLSPSSGWYNIGTQVQISASPNSGYIFVSWSGSGSGSYSGTNNPATITLNSPITETANFDTSITFNANGLNSNAQGTVLTVNGQSYTYSQLPVTFYATPGSSFSFSWSSPISGGSGALFVWKSTSGLSTSQSGTITVSTPGSVTASYNEYYAITINAGSGGSVSWSLVSGTGSVYGSSSGTVSAGQSQTVYVTSNTELQLTDNPNSGYTFVSWSFSGYVAPPQGYSSNDNPIVIQNTGSTGSVSATYQYSDYLQFTVSTTAPSTIGFTITLSNGQSQQGNTATQPTVTFYLPYGTYSWSISPTSVKYYSHNIQYVYVATPSSSSATTNATVSINYVLSSATYQYTWSESGLPSGTQWGVSVNGNNYYTTSSSLTETFSTGQTYSWSVINPSGYVGTPPSGSFSSPGSQSITFYSTPSVSINANPSSGSAPLTVTFTASVSGGSGNYEYNFYYMDNSGNYQWSGWQYSNTFTYTYTSSGVYYAMVEVEDTVTGATAYSNNAQVTVTAPPLQVSISAYPTSGYVPLGVQFYSYVSGGVGNYQYTWYFGDGGTSTQANPYYTYYSPGTYWAELLVQSGNQQAWSNQITITVMQPLSVTASANPTSGTAPLTVSFSASASGGSGGYSYYWTFGDGGSSYSQNPTYTYYNPGTYTATVTVTDSNGDQASASVTITVTQSLSVTIYAYPTSGNAPLGVQFYSYVSGGSGNYQYTWFFGDGGSSNAQNPYYIYYNPGTYYAQLYVTDSAGDQAWSNAITITVTQQQALSVSAYANPTSGTQPLTVTYTASGSGGSGSYYYTLYVDGNPVGNTVGPTGGSATITYTFQQAGTYSTYIQVMDANTYNTANSQTITINVQAPSGTYSLTFTESGLPSTNWVGQPVTWSVTVNGQSQSAQAGQSITFTGLSGTVSWSVQSPIVVRVNRYHAVKYYAHPSSGTASSGGTISITYQDPPSVFSSARVSLFSLIEKIINILHLVFQSALLNFKIFANAFIFILNHSFTFS